MISRLDLVSDYFAIFEIFEFLGRPFWECFGANAHKNGGVKKSRKKTQKGSRREKAPWTCFPLKEENLRLPSSEFCRFAIGSYTLSVLEARWRITNRNYTNNTNSLNNIKYINHLNTMNNIQNINSLNHSNKIATIIF